MAAGRLFLNTKQPFEMDWLNLHTKELDSPEVVGAEPIDRGTWLMLLRYCAGQENGGVIRDCRGWKDRKWQQLARVTLAEVNRECDLWNWSGDDLAVTHYPLEKEQEVKHLRAIGRMSTPAKRAAAKANGELGGRPTENRTGNPTETQHGTEQEPNKKPIQGKGREIEGKEKGKEAVEDGGSSATEDARKLCEMHPKRDLSQPALRAALGAIERHGFALVAEGVRAYAAAVAEWTPAERMQFVKAAPEFFGEDCWNQPAANWGGRKQRGAVLPVNGHREINIGGRKPKFNIMNQLFPETTKP